MQIEIEMFKNEDTLITDTMSRKDKFLFLDAIDFAKHTRKEVLFLDENLTTHIISTVDASDELVTYYEGWRCDYGLII